MARLVLLLSGLPDDPADALEGATPLEAAATPSLDWLASRAEVGVVQPLPELPAGASALGADLTTLALLGYPAVGVGRGAVELLGAGAAVGRRAVGLRFDLLTTDEDGSLTPFAERPLPEEAEVLWPDLAAVARGAGLDLRPVAAETGLAFWEAGPDDLHCVPSGELPKAQPLEASYPQGDAAERLAKVIDDGRDLLADHRVNRIRRAESRPTFEVCWPWGAGRAPELEMFLFRTGHVASVLTDSLAVRGVARAVGANAPQRRGQRPSSLTDLANAMLATAAHAPTVIGHCAACDQAGHAGGPEAKRDAVAEIDRFLVRPLVELAVGNPHLELIVLSDYATCCATRRHGNRPAPYLLWSAGRERSGPRTWTEATAAETGRQRLGWEELLAWLWRLS